MLHDGALVAAVLMYIAVRRSQSLLREAHRTNRKQLEQLKAAYSELLQTLTNILKHADANQVEVVVKEETERETEVLQLLAYGKRNHEIAAILCISEGTTKTHIHHIMLKLGAQDRTQAVVAAIRTKLVK